MEDIWQTETGTWKSPLKFGLSPHTKFKRMILETVTNHIMSNFGWKQEFLFERHL